MCVGDFGEIISDQNVRVSPGAKIGILARNVDASEETMYGREYIVPALATPSYCSTLAQLLVLTLN
jgi:hypothetical protein